MAILFNFTSVGQYRAIATGMVGTAMAVEIFDKVTNKFEPILLVASIV